MAEAASVKAPILGKQAKADLPRVLVRVKAREEVEIARSGVPVARLSHIESPANPGAAFLAARGCRYSGGDGNDTIKSVNGNRGTVNCGREDAPKKGRRILHSGLHHPLHCRRSVGASSG